MNLSEQELASAQGDYTFAVRPQNDGSTLVGVVYLPTKEFVPPLTKTVATEEDVTAAISEAQRWLHILGPNNDLAADVDARMKKRTV